ncbi:hypothetical protein [Aquimarina longa]|uniref:hypothetical protein n=1 Tax=Aquimarina longa TaxID=1080221 RepID=UPI00078104C8|nr:hypothetical protein [Aquimarina longa]
MKRVLITILIITLGQSVFSQERINDLSIESIEYEANSRGFYQKMKVSKKTFVYSEDRARKKSKTVKISNKQWREIVNLADKIKFKELSSFKAPSEKRKSDGAAHAQLKVFYKNDINESSNFDHGNPPVEIKDLVEYIINLSKSTNKL